MSSISPSTLSTLSSKGFTSVPFANPILGRGGFAQVYLMQSRQGKVAIKAIDKSRLTTRGHVRRLRQEVEIQKTLDHRNVVKLFEYFEDRQCVYLVLEYCDLGCLRQYLKRNYPKIKETEVKSIFEQSATAVKYLHDAHITHRDVSLGNLLLSSNRMTAEIIVKLGDFGLSKSLLSSNNTDESSEEDCFGNNRRPDQTLCGTPNFIAPENMNGHHEQGLYGDVWSLGCVLYALLMGRPPFEGENCKMTMNRVSNGKFVFSNEVVLRYPAGCELIGQMLKLDPMQRICVDAILVHPFLSVTTTYSKVSSDKSDSGIVRSCEATKFCSKPTAAPNTTLESCQSSLYLSDMSLMSSRSASHDPAKCMETMESTKRLRPIRAKINNVMMTLTKSGEVIMEFLADSTSSNNNGDQIAITGVMRISSDGQKIKIYNPTTSVFSPSSDEDPDTSAISALAYQEFDRQNLPAIHWKRYRLACKFVNRIRARTQKVKLFTDEASCVLFESSPDFEIQFKSGHKLCVVDTTKACLTCPNQPSIQLNWQRFDESCFSSTIKRILILGKELHRFCLDQEAHFEKYTQDNPGFNQCFPVVLGRPQNWNK